MYSLISNIVADIHRPGPDDICGHTTELTTTKFFISWFWLI